MASGFGDEGSWQSYEHTASPPVWPGLVPLSGKNDQNLDDSGQSGADHYRQALTDVGFLTDFAHTQGQHLFFHFCFSWPRLYVGRTQKLSAPGLAHYDRFIDRLLAANITPAAILHHWELPQSLARQGGWSQRDLAWRFADYAASLARIFGDRVKNWASFYDPARSVWWGYNPQLLSSPPLQAPNADTALKALAHHQLAGALALCALRQEQADARVGQWLSYGTLSAADKGLTAPFIAHWLLAFLVPAWHGGDARPLSQIFAAAKPLIPTPTSEGPELFNPQELSQAYNALCKRLAAWQKPEDMAYIGTYQEDWLGLLYQDAWHITAHPLGLPDFIATTPHNPVKLAPALCQSLQEISMFSGGAPLWLALNHPCWLELDGKTSPPPSPFETNKKKADPDLARIEYLGAALSCLQHLRPHMPHFRGLFYDGWLDSFSWKEGYERQGGLIAIEGTGYKRRPKGSFDWFAKALADF
jgi:beta-glucosidase